MKKDTLIAILSIVSIVSVVITVTMLITYINRNGNSGDEGKTDYRSHFLVNYLNFTPEQTDLFEVINESHIRNKMNIGIQMVELNDAFARNPNRDRKEEEERYYNMLIKLHMDIQQQVYNYYGKVRSICNEEQKSRCDKFFRTIICLDGSCCETFGKKLTDL